MIRSCRSNPLAATGRLPDVRAPLAVGLVAAAALAAYGLYAEWSLRREQAAAVAAAAETLGHGAARADHVGPGCGRARRLYRWEAAGASGTACAGPAGRAEIRTVLRRPAPAA